MSFLTGCLVGALAVAWWFERGVVWKEPEEDDEFYVYDNANTTGDLCTTRWHRHPGTVTVR